MELLLYNKTATKTAESGWMDFKFRKNNNYKYKYSKLGNIIDPLDVI